jgi:hypothetical protein
LKGKYFRNNIILTILPEDLENYVLKPLFSFPTGIHAKNIEAVVEVELYSSNKLHP